MHTTASDRKNAVCEVRPLPGPFFLLALGSFSFSVSFQQQQVWTSAVKAPD